MTKQRPRSEWWQTSLLMTGEVMGTGILGLPDAAARLGWAASLISLFSYGAILKALETAPASYVVAVRQSSVIFALVLGVVRLREQPGRARLLGALATVAGVVLIARYGS